MHTATPFAVAQVPWPEQLTPAQRSTSGTQVVLPAAWYPGPQTQAGALAATAQVPPGPQSTPAQGSVTSSATQDSLSAW